MESHKDIDMGFGEVHLWIHNSISHQDLNPFKDDSITAILDCAITESSANFTSYNWNRIYWGGESVNIMLSRLSSFGEDKYTFTFKGDVTYGILNNELHQAYDYLILAKEDGDPEYIETAEYLYKRASRRIDMYASDHDYDDDDYDNHHYVYNRTKKVKNAKRSSDKEHILSLEKEDRKARRQEKMKRYYY